VSEWVDS